MPYGTLAVDSITPTANLSITGTIVPSAGVFASNAPGINRIINGAMVMDQRNSGTAQTITAAAALAYTVDRWYAYCTGANVTGQRVAGTGGNLYAYRFTGAASVTAIGFGQRIEALNSADLAGTTATLAVDLANSLLTTVTWTAYYANTTDTFGTLASPTRTQIATGTFTVNATLTRYSTQISIPAAATTGIEIVFTVGAQTSGTWTIDNVQLEAGSLASTFERRQLGQELSLCQRYYFTSFFPSAVGTSGLSAGYISKVAEGTVLYASLQGFFPVSMRTYPNMTVYNPSTGGTGTIRNSNAGTNISASAVNIGFQTFQIQVNNVSVSANQQLLAHYTADAEL
jgi:hypothetical protein